MWPFRSAYDRTLLTYHFHKLQSCTEVVKDHSKQNNASSVSRTMSAYLKHQREPGFLPIVTGQEPGTDCTVSSYCPQRKVAEMDSVEWFVFHQPCRRLFEQRSPCELPAVGLQKRNDATLV